MAEIQPFKAVMYSHEKIDDISQVLTPPYDVISPKQQEEFYNQHPNNFVRIDFGQESPDDDEESNRYRRANGFLESWLSEGMLQQDENPSIYVYDQSYHVLNKEFTRRSFVALVRVEPYASKVILPHELTHAGPKVDRLNLTKATHSAFSQIFALYEDEECSINERLDSACGTPAFEFTEPHGGTSRVFRVQDSDVIQYVQSYMKDRPLYIADGHHRYETSLNFSEYAKAQIPNLPGAQYITMSCVSMNDPGLVILPTHRSVKLPQGQTVEMFLKAIDARFDRRPETDLSQVLASIGRSESIVRIGLYVPAEGFSLVSVDVDKNSAAIGTHSATWRGLDVSVLHQRLLHECMQFPQEELFSKGPIFYNHSAEECLQKVNAGEFDLTLFVSNATLADLKAIVQSSEVMPPKSTFFYPKLMSGLFTYRMASFDQPEETFI